METKQRLRNFFLNRPMAHELEDSLPCLTYSEASMLLTNNLTIYTIPFGVGGETLYVNNLRLKGTRLLDKNKLTFCWLNKRSIKAAGKQ
jgi:hypothetical protein